MTTLAPEEVRRMAWKFRKPIELHAEPMATVTPAKKRRIRIRINRNNSAAAVIMQSELMRIMPILAEQSRVPVDMICGKGRKQPAVDARLMAYAYLRDRGYSLPLIGRAMGGRDHTTIVAGLKRWQAHMDTVPGFGMAWRRFMEALNQ